MKCPAENIRSIKINTTFESSLSDSMQPVFEFKKELTSPGNKMSVIKSNIHRGRMNIKRPAK
jgi:hypothetical protein